MEEKERLDVRLVREGLAPSRERAKEWIQQGQVAVDSAICQKAGTMVKANAELTVTAEPLPYVSRGGLKLEKALRWFELSVEGQVCLDAGASTGGFTDCMLQRGAVRVYAVDVGTDQLAAKLRQDGRVVSIENTNVKELSPEIIPELCDFASADLSFISLTKTLPAISSCLKDGAQLVCLVKPQFEAGRDKIGKKGVVKDPKIHRQVLERITDFCEAMGLRVQGLTASPIRGQAGNIEFLIWLYKGSANSRQRNLPDLIEAALQERQKV